MADQDRNWARNLVDGHRVLPALLADLASARRTIHLSIFLFFNDAIGKEIAEALCARARAGVAVRVLVNMGKTEMGDPFSTGEREMMEHDPSADAGEVMDVEALAARLKASGVAVCDSNLDFDRPPPTRDPALLEQARLVRETSRMDAAHVDHRKLVTVDGRIGYCGSANIGAQYLHRIAFDPGVDAKEEGAHARAAGRAEPWWKWHDGLVRFEGPVVRDLDACFRERWVLDGGEDFPPVEPAPGAAAPDGIPLDAVEIHKNQPDSTPNPVRALFLDCIGRARESIFIENPYVYHPAIIRALLAARRRRPAPRIDLVVPGMAWNDSEYSQDAMQHHYRALLGHGVNVFEYQNHFTHLKLATFDERVSIVGSANLNFRSLEDDCDFELVARVASAAFARSILSEVRDVDLRHARRLSRRDLSWRERTRDPRTLLLVWRRLI